MTLAAARPAADDHGGLGVGSARPVHGVQHVLVGVPLLVQQDELLPLLHLCGRQRQELLGGTDPAGQQVVGVWRAAHPGLEPRAQELDELSSTLAGEEPAVVTVRGGGHVVEVRDPEIGGVVQVCRSGQLVGVLGKGHHEVGEVFAIAADLLQRVGYGAVPVVLDPHQVGAVLEPLGRAPLLELDDHVGGMARLRMAPGEHDVRAFAGEGQLVLDEHLDVVQAGVEQVCPQGREAAAPGALLGGGRRAPGLDDHLLGQVVRQARLIRGQPSGGGAEQVHGQDPKQHESTRAGGGVSVVEARRAAMTPSL